MKVRCYWNLHRKIWSVQDAKSRRVIAHADQVLLDDVEFKVSETGRQRVLVEKRKNVHAFAVGELVAMTPPDNWSARTGELALDIKQRGRAVTYNPYKAGTFVAECGSIVKEILPITEARRVYLTWQSMDGIPRARVHAA